TVALVSGGFVEGETFDEGTSVLGKNRDPGIAQNCLHSAYCGPADVRVFFGQRIQELDKDRIGGQNPRACERIRALEGSLMVSMEWISESDPVSRVGEDLPQERLPYR